MKRAARLPPRKWCSVRSRVSTRMVGPLRVMRFFLSSGTRTRIPRISGRTGCGPGNCGMSRRGFRLKYRWMSRKYRFLPTAAGVSTGKSIARDVTSWSRISNNRESSRGDPPSVLTSPLFAQPVSSKLPVTVDGNDRATEFRGDFRGGETFEDLHLDDGANLGLDGGEAGKQVLDLKDGGITVETKPFPQRDLLSLTRKWASVVNEQAPHDLSGQAEKDSLFVIAVAVRRLERLNLD